MTGQNIKVYQQKELKLRCIKTDKKTRNYIFSLPHDKSRRNWTRKNKFFSQEFCSRWIKLKKKYLDEANKLNKQPRRSRKLNMQKILLNLKFPKKGNQMKETWQEVQ